MKNPMDSPFWLVNSHENPYIRGSTLVIQDLLQDHLLRVRVRRDPEGVLVRPGTRRSGAGLQKRWHGSVARQRWHDHSNGTGTTGTTHDSPWWFTMTFFCLSPVFITFISHIWCAWVKTEAPTFSRMISCWKISPTLQWWVGHLEAQMCCCYTNVMIIHYDPYPILSQSYLLSPELVEKWECGECAMFPTFGGQITLVRPQFRFSL